MRLKAFTYLSNAIVKIGIVCLFALTHDGLAATKHLSLINAIHLALKDNPNVISSQLNYENSQSNLKLAQYQFIPHVALSSSVGYQSVKGQPDSNRLTENINGNVSWVSSIGTESKLIYGATHDKTKQTHLSMTVSQPLLKGFGKPVVEASLNNAFDSVTMSRLRVEETIRSTITSVILAYLDVMMAEKTVEIDENALKRAKESLKQTDWYIKAGHKAGNERITVSANVASVALQLENDKQRLSESTYAFLMTIGIDPDSKMIIDPVILEDLMNQYHLIDQDTFKQRAIQSNIQYQIDEMTLHGISQRAVMQAEDNTRLDLRLNAAINSDNEILTRSGIDNRTNEVNLTLNIPINDVEAKTSLAIQKNSIKEAFIQLRKERWQLNRDIQNVWNSVISSKKALGLARQAGVWQKKSYDLSYQKYLHGLIDSIELQSAETQFIQSEQSELLATINYLKSLIQFDALCGHTIDTWQIKVKLT